jgi:hypothetical protein
LTHRIHIPESYRDRIAQIQEGSLFFELSYCL